MPWRSFEGVPPEKGHLGVSSSRTPRPLPRETRRATCPSASPRASSLHRGTQERVGHLPVHCPSKGYVQALCEWCPFDGPELQQRRLQRECRSAQFRVRADVDLLPNRVRPARLSLHRYALVLQLEP